jgi:hypothetical protein
VTSYRGEELLRLLIVDYIVEFTPLRAFGSQQATYRTCNRHLESFRGGALLTLTSLATARNDRGWNVISATEIARRVSPNTNGNNVFASHHEKLVYRMICA